MEKIMICELNINKDCDFVKFFRIINEMGSFCIYDNFFYLDSEYSLEKVVEKLSPSSVTEITLKNIDVIKNDFAKKWCHEKLISKYIKEFESSEEGKKRIKEVNDILNKLESIGGETNGQTEKESGVNIGKTNNKKDCSGGKSTPNGSRGRKKMGEVPKK